MRGVPVCAGETTITWYASSSSSPRHLDDRDKALPTTTHFKFWTLAIPQVSKTRRFGLRDISAVKDVTGALSSSRPVLLVVKEISEFQSTSAAADTVT